MYAPTPTNRLVPRVPAVLVAVLVAVVSFALSRVLWPDPVGAMTPPSTLLPLFVLLGVVESVAFGLGAAFVVFGLAPLRRAGAGAGLTWAAFLSISFMLLSWWPHDNLHRVMAHNDFAALAWIEYLFHVPLIIGAAIVAAFFLRVAAPRLATVPAAAVGGSRENA